MPDVTPTSFPDSAAVSGFWRRIAAFVVDALILGLVGYAIGLLFFDTLVRLGPWGRVVGFAVSLLYFVPQESGRGGGQSLGKRLLGIRVVDAAGAPLGGGRGAARFAVFGVPYFLNGAVLPMGLTTLAGGFPLALVAFGGVLALGYLLVFNRRTRQSLHDLATGAFVVRVVEGAGQAPPAVRAWRGHLVVVGLLFLLAGATPLLLPQLMRVPMSAGVQSVYLRLAVQPELRSVNVFESAGRVYGLDFVGVRRELLIQATIGAPLSDYVPLSTRLAGIALSVFPEAAKEDRISVRLAHGFDIGIAASWTYNELALTPAQWVDRVGAGGN
ncbi:MAG: RDD family protein [Betaproteobacteria bacterium]